MFFSLIFAVMWNKFIRDKLDSRKASDAEDTDPVLIGSVSCGSRNKSLVRGKPEVTYTVKGIYHFPSFSDTWNWVYYTLGDSNTGLISDQLTTTYSIEFSGNPNFGYSVDCFSLHPANHNGYLMAETELLNFRTRWLNPSEAVYKRKATKGGTALCSLKKDGVLLYG